MFKTKGDRLESLVQYVYQTLLNNTNSVIKVERQKKLIGKSGVTHVIDVYYEFILNEITHKVIIECKNWKSKVSKEKILVLNSIIEDIPHSVGIIISPKGFQKGAKEFAKHHEIILVSDNDRSLFIKAVTSRLDTLLPDENVKGEPFWCLMDSKTGNYVTNNGVLSLFTSKKLTLDLSNKLGGEVRGISQHHLKMICMYNKMFGLKIFLHFLDIDNGVMVNYELLEDYFLIK